MSNLIKRTVPVILVLIVCITCLVFPASASSFEVPNTFYDVLSHSSPNNSDGTDVRFTGSASISFELPGSMIFTYVDILVSSVDPVKSASIEGTALTVNKVSDGIYRIFGNIPTFVYSEIVITITCSADTLLNFISFHATNKGMSGVPILGSIEYYDLSGWITESHMSSPSSTLNYTFPDNGNEVQRFYVSMFSHVWYKYDYLAFRFRTRMNVSSILAMTADKQIPISVSSSIVSDITTEDNIVLYYCVIDVSSLKRSDDLSSMAPPILEVQLTSYGDDSRQFIFYDCTGFTLIDDVDPDVTWLRKLYHIFSDKLDSVIDELKKFTGSGADSDAISAQQKQEEINVSINNQLVGAVEDWNTNIEVVQTGYDLALTKVTPALSWLATLADGIFNGMGWFGNIYFLIGLISVIMLVLSKSGLARSIGRFRRD